MNKSFDNWNKTNWMILVDGHLKYITGNKYNTFLCAGQGKIIIKYKTSIVNDVKLETIMHS